MTSCEADENIETDPDAAAVFEASADCEADSLRRDNEDTEPVELADEKTVADAEALSDERVESDALLEG